MPEDQEASTILFLTSIQLKSLENSSVESRVELQDDIWYSLIHLLTDSLFVSQERLFQTGESFQLVLTRERVDLEDGFLYQINRLIELLLPNMLL